MLLLPCCVGIPGKHLPVGVPRLAVDQATALGAFTFDLGADSDTADGSDNLYYRLNMHLRDRDGSKLRTIKPYGPYLAYLPRALQPVGVARGAVTTVLRASVV